MLKTKQFITNFNSSKPDWTNLPKGFPDCELDGLESSEVGKFNAIKTMWELLKPKKPKSRSRVWKDPKGYQYLGVWQNAALLRVIKGPQKGKVWGEPTEPSHPYYEPLNTLNPRTLTYEEFMELINKTDWLLSKLTESLEAKLNRDRKGYKVEQARIKGNILKNR